MNLYEYMGKEIFRNYGIPVPDGYTIEKTDEIRDVSYPVAIKSQILIGKRGKAGGIKFADNKSDAVKYASELLGSKINGMTVTKLLIEKKLDIKKELYLSITMDRTNRAPVIIASTEGGMDIEEVPDDKIVKRVIDPLIGYSQYIGREIVSSMKLDADLSKSFLEILERLYRVFMGEDALLVEINPLVIDGNKNIIAADSKIVLDDNALFRHKEINIRDPEKTELEIESQSKSFTFIEMDGDIGVIANGAGLTMATLDALTLHNLKPRNFLDLGGTDSIDIVKDAFSFVMKADPDIIFVNIFGGVTKADTVANGIVASKKEFNITKPIVVRLSGIHEDEGRRILKDNGINAFSNMNDAILDIVKIKEGK
ncbi:ADP-forming succinate--CoA ligase subunit beta [Picrophilus oshimae]|uniref:Succinyl-CoA synthetase (ADP-forming) beta subunit n=1 Tax=Picrophilus torridus (strain ATCC 700027 / DSM 9790 / JCM 10055 / NBRC 100828 / KAW 2/3) TaxID=1122961 RepID=A0A8G2L7K4_PICTO|nr:ADP-forming succinate--CoA ligase subunit beta [Picrophilus oshimae]SMD31212.1 succinyl-CoA synthetase (ADP-forming) beta subunit [Picrophilus oshimae DSM 9789]